jgi:hypothetical protein
MRAGVVRTQLENESISFCTSNLVISETTIDNRVYIRTTAQICNNIPGFTVKIICVSLAILLHLIITILQARTLLKGIGAKDQGQFAEEQPKVHIKMSVEE